MELQSKRINHLKYLCPAKCPVVLKLPYIGNNPHINENILNELTRKSYYTINPRITF